MKSNRLVWLDFLKGLAICAVVLDHLYGVFYKNIFIQQHTSFSVALFIFLAGITTAMSLSKYNLFQFYKKRLLAIINPYILATFLISLFIHKPFLSSLINFNAAGPFYFIAFFLQLLLIAPILNKLNYFFLPLIFAVSFLLNRFHFTNLWGGGEFLFGGSFLFLFYLGIIFYKNISFFKPKFIFSVIAALVLIFFELFNLIPNTWHNPPYLLTMLYTFTIFSIFYNLSLPSNNPVIRLFSFFGRYSLYIFLYHSLIFPMLEKILKIT